MIMSTSCQEVVVNANECLLTPAESKLGAITYKGYDILKTDGSYDESENADCLIPETLRDLKFTVNYKLINYNESQEAKFHQVIEKVLLVLSSVEFRDRVLNHTYEGERTFANPEVEGVSLTNEEIYNKIVEGTELILRDRTGESHDNEMDLELKMYYKRFSSVVGWTNPDIMTIHTNSKYYNPNPHSKVGANFVHEWLHKLGFGHDFNRTAKRPYSVPYAVGGIISDLIEKMNGQTPSEGQELASL
jgi:hypothetical protein